MDRIGQKSAPDAQHAIASERSQGKRRQTDSAQAQHGHQEQWWTGHMPPPPSLDRSELPYRRSSSDRRSDEWDSYPMAPGIEERRNSALSIGVEVPLAMGPPAPPLPKPTASRPRFADRASSYHYPILKKTSLTPIPQSPTQPSIKEDPSIVKLPPVRERKISAPIQPRVFDLRMHMERDTQRPVPTFEVVVRFSFSMQPGELQ